MKTAFTILGLTLIAPLVVWMIAFAAAAFYFINENNEGDNDE